ncbi:NF-kappa-B inhibitor-like protein 1 [Dunckerocampus dactyliophorus]|uniref:NF-kappa-B inhibitor-like protein 1 n=1 Tax=Dunckerocampus dactyliophorus TaxID=161453 RepID=UPI0024074909|nr:NF-kappa-B inhibitor-like protein 1 [Dunckerocampus dactyliophorus]
MLTHDQKRLWKYVEEGSLLKLKSYLRKHQDLDVNFTQGKRQRSPLHLACSLGDDAMLRLLLEHGADVLRRDRKGDTALHVAVNRSLKHGKTAYDDLVVPLRKSCPEAMNASNIAGVTPQDLLNWTKHSEKTAASTSTRSEDDPERDWMEKLFGECEDEFCETFGVYDADDFLPVDDEEEDYGDWADRIRREYFSKKHAEAQRMAASSSSGWKKKKSKREGEEQSYKELHQRLQKEHEEYLARATRKEEETRQGKKRRYDQMCAATFNAAAADDREAKLLSYGDIPWPAPRGTVQEMADVMLHGVDRKDAVGFRKALRKQQTLWHPDKFAQRCEARLEEKDKQRILDTVTALSQELNRLAQGLRT